MLNSGQNLVKIWLDSGSIRAYYGHVSGQDRAVIAGARRGELPDTLKKKLLKVLDMVRVDRPKMFARQPPKKTKGIKKVTDSKAELSACCNAPLFPHLDEAESHSWEDVANAPLVCEICGEYQTDEMTISTGAMLETHHFTFWAFGNSKSECRRMLADRWKLHQKQTNASYEFEELADSVFYFGITKGAFRDGELPEGN